MAAKARRVPKGEKPADTIAYQKRMIETLTARIEELSICRGEDGARISTLEGQIKASGSVQNDLRERLRDKEHQLTLSHQEIARLSGYIQRVREVERNDEEPHPISGPPELDIHALTGGKIRR